MTPLETKTAGDTMIADLNQSFTAFREANDERLAQLETRLGADVLT